MRKKKLAAGMVSVMLAGVMVMPVLAEEKLADLQVVYGENSSYTLHIPETINLPSIGGYAEINIGASKVNLAPDKKMQIKIKSGITENGKVELSRKGDTSTKIISDVSLSTGATVHVGDVLVEFIGIDSTPYTGVRFSKANDSSDPLAEIKAGEYTGTVVFEGTLVDSASKALEN